MKWKWLSGGFGMSNVRAGIRVMLPRAAILAALMLLSVPGRAQTTNNLIDRAANGLSDAVNDVLGDTNKTATPAQPPVFQVTITNSSTPKSATVVNIPPDLVNSGVGDIQVTFGDGSTELFTKGEKCRKPEVSARGDVGWAVWHDLTDDAYHHKSETLRLRLRDGTIKEFQPNNLFILDWAFADNDTVVIIKSMAHHGPPSFIEYHIATGRELGRLDGYAPYAEMPKWAQPYSDEKP